MCGILGIIGKNTDVDIRKLGLWQNHRGPDAWGEFSNQYIKFGHNRLSILDIELGKQPMTTTDEDYTLVFNGEIYNYVEIKEELIKLGCKFETKNSDTEVLLLGYKKFGFKIFNKLRGMFAGCIYDRNKNQCVLFRDSVGIKPLYYFKDSDHLFFSSELKPLIKHIKCPEFNTNELVHYFTNRCTSINSTFINGAKKVLPGTFMTINCDSLECVVKKYKLQNKTKSNLTYKEKLKKLDKLLETSVTNHMVSDVPVGVFLSGGVDSSLISYYSTKLKKIKAFNLGTKSKWDETKFAKKAADDLNIKLETKYLSDENILDYFEKWAYHNDDPVADPSAMALMALTDHVRSKDYKVMLAGEGADELFLGYNIYIKYILFSHLKNIPSFLLNIIPWNKTQIIDWRKYKSFFGAGHISNFKERILLLSNNNLNVSKNINSNDFHKEFKEKDYENRLPNDLLTRTDRATMAFSIEARVPFLINEIIDFSDSLKLNDLVELRKSNGKRILKDLAVKYISKGLVRRKKKGFEIPIDIWIQEKFKKQIDVFIKSENIPGINYKGVKKLIFQKNFALIWAWLVLEKWYENWFLEGVKEPIISPYINKKSYRCN